MSNKTALKEIENRSCTRGPYKWRKSPKGKRIALVSPHGGETIVMDFVSRGAQGAQPRFNCHRMGIMLTADEWGDELLNHPDLKLLEASYELFELCKGVLKLESMEVDPLMSANKRQLFLTQLVRHAESLVKRIEGENDEN